MSPPRFSGCIYCGCRRVVVWSGGLSLGELPACAAHVDVLALDPAYAYDGQAATIACPTIALSPWPSANRRQEPAAPAPVLLAATPRLALRDARGRLLASLPRPP